VRVAVVVPTYNEVDNIAGLLSKLLACDCRPDVVVVDDNSPDGTADLVRAWHGSQPRVSLHPRQRKDGLGAAYVDGFTHVLGQNRYDAVVQMDADGSHAAEDVDRLVAALDRGDLVIGSRYVPGGAVDGWPAGRRILSRFGNVYARAWLGLPLRDLTGGFKAWRADTLATLGLGHVRSDGYAFQVEMTARAVARGARVTEVPITFRNRSAGTSKMDARIAVEALRVVPTLRRQRLTR